MNIFCARGREKMKITNETFVPRHFFFTKNRTDFFLSLSCGRQNCFFKFQQLRLQDPSKIWIQSPRITSYAHLTQQNFYESNPATISRIFKVEGSRLDCVFWGLNIMRELTTLDEYTLFFISIKFISILRLKFTKNKHNSKHTSKLRCKKILAVFLKMLTFLG